MAGRKPRVRSVATGRAPSRLGRSCRRACRSDNHGGSGGHVDRLPRVTAVTGSGSEGVVVLDEEGKALAGVPRWHGGGTAGRAAHGPSVGVRRRRACDAAPARASLRRPGQRRRAADHHRGQSAAGPARRVVFAAVGGASPIPASSRRTHRHRPDRGGDRQANAALYPIALTRLRCDPRTREYLKPWRRHVRVGPPGRPDAPRAPSG